MTIFRYKRAPLKLIGARSGCSVKPCLDIFDCAHGLASGLVDIGSTCQPQRTTFTSQKPRQLKLAICSARISLRHMKLLIQGALGIQQAAHHRQMALPRRQVQRRLALLVWGSDSGSSQIVAPFGSPRKTKCLFFGSPPEWLLSVLENPTRQNKTTKPTQKFHRVSFGLTGVTHPLAQASSRFRRLTNWIAGLPPPDLSTLSGRPKLGKTNGS